jgi:hypothetical protein
LTDGIAAERKVQGASLGFRQPWQAPRDWALKRAHPAGGPFTGRRSRLHQASTYSLSDVQRGSCECMADVPRGMIKAKPRLGLPHRPGLTSSHTSNHWQPPSQICSGALLMKLDSCPSRVWSWVVPILRVRQEMRPHNHLLGAISIPRSPCTPQGWMPLPEGPG